MAYTREIAAYQRGFEDGKNEVEEKLQLELELMADNARRRGYREGYEDAMDKVRRVVNDE